jgi:hypothetical protein
VIIVPRSVWGARYPAGFGVAPLPAREVWLHHTAMTAPGVTASDALDANAMRLVEGIGHQRFGGGVSYTFVVMPSGRIMEGTGVGRRGAHTAGRNSIARAICLHGNYEDNEPSSAQLTAVVDLLRYGYVMRWWDAPQLDGGHRDAPDASTACPGRHAYRLIPEINRQAATPAAHHEDDDMSAEAERMIGEIHRELFHRLPNRRGDGGTEIVGGGADTVLGYAANADGMAYQAAGSLNALHEKLDELADLVRASGADPHAFANAVAGDLARRLEG